MLSLDRLHTFTVAAEELNFTHAARRLGLSQPAISLQIKELEETLEVSLFERTGRRLLLTPAGERLRPLALSILRSVDAACNELAEFRSVYQGVLRIGAGTTLGIYLLPYALGAFSKLFPGIRASLQVNEVDVIVREMSDNNLDLALVEEDLTPGRIHGWDKVPFMQDELVLIGSPDHPWAQRSQVALEDLETESYIFRPGYSPVRQLIHDRLSAAHVDPNKLHIRFELNNTEGIKRAVMAGLGLAFVSRCAIAMELEAGRLKEITIPGLDLHRTLWLLRPAENKLTANQQRFCDVVLGGDWIPHAMQPLAKA